MLLLMLDEARRLDKPCLDKDGKLTYLSKETCLFVLQYCFECMSGREAHLAMEHNHKTERERDLFT